MGGDSIYPEELKYTKDHEWVRVVDNVAEIGITNYAQDQLGDVVYVDLPNIGEEVIAGKVFGSIESVKAVSELFSPIGGRIVDVNSALSEHPEVVNSEPHVTWMVKIQIPSSGSTLELLDHNQYTQLVNG